MDLEYDRKFEEMKKYIPFLENMIKRLEITSSQSNPRQAQLDKIKSLRDLLMDKKKRMKMENLLKCEQVLVNLYEKVEQRDSLPAPKKVGNTLQKDKSDLNTVRNKLKSAVSKLQNENVETLPEIARASDTEEVCVPGSKEPALFQRRPNKSSMSPTRPVPNKTKETSQMPKRNYTRVLLSPEPGQKNWSSEENSSEKPLFSRRSPRKSPRRRSPSYHRKERRKSIKNKLKEIESKDLNITLNVPEESLNSLNTTDILSRIINCSDNDVDIDTLRELRTQILGELKETGANEDISDLILKSYKKKGIKHKKTEEVEEGELSDSESEAIESIYGSLVIMDKEKSSTSVSKKIQNEEKPRKIQICLVINSDKNKLTSSKEENDKVSPVDNTDFETFSSEKESEINKKTVFNLENIAVIKENILNQSKSDQVRTDVVDEQNSNFVASFDKKNDDTQLCKGNEEKKLVAQNTKNDENFETKKEIEYVESKEIIKPNFYNPIIEKHEQEKGINKYIPEDKLNNKFQSKTSNEENPAESCENTNTTTKKSNVEIPLLEPPKKVSEIDILQALKKEILSETDSVLSSEADTPLLHQPKITKVVNAHEIGSKKRISIENYKAKTTPLKTIFGNENFANAPKEDINKKQSLKLTEKECERFNFPSKLTLDESSDDENKSMDDIYENLAPKSPDHEDFADTGIKPPVIIPSDPVQTSAISSDADVDMRKLLPVLQPNLNTDVHNSLSYCNDKTLTNFNADNEIIKSNDKQATVLHDPRMKKDINAIIKTDSSNAYLMNVDTTPVNYINSSGSTNLLQNVNSNSSLTLNVNVAANRSIMSPNLPSNVMSNITPIMTSNLAPNMPPSRTSNIAPNMTPNARSYDMTPSRQIVDNDDFSNPKQVYVPMFPSFDTRDHNENQQWDSPDSNRLPFWEDSRSNSVHRDMDYRNPRNISAKRDSDYKDLRSNSLQRDMEYKPYEQYQTGPIKNRYNNEKIDTFHRTDCPTTPINPFGRLDCPATPTTSFGRMDVPMTPVHSFGRSECPSTPSHPFGRPEPILPTPFVRPDFNQHLPNQSYGKPLDPRLSRKSEYDNYHNRDDDRERDCFQEPKFNSHSYKSDHNNRNNNSELFRRYQRKQSISRNEKNKNYEQTGRNYRDSRRETNVGRYSRDYDNDRLYSRNRSTSSRRYDYRIQDESKYDESDRRSYQREKSVGRMSSRSSTGDSSVGRTFSKDQLSAQRHAGRSFTIDTSINSTFQEIDSKNNKISSFDARRQRAASVGRTLVHDSSQNKIPNNESKHRFNNLENKNKKLNFRRACSVGREMKDSKLDFKDIKADLKSFKLKGESRWSKEVNNSDETIKTTEIIRNFDPRSRQEIYKNHIKSNEGNIKYSPRKNNRDPRMRRENSSEKKNRDDYRSKSKDSTSFGIVYSNDNITKGNILGPGYGVKNYKIPKIKRPHETDVKNESNESKSKNNTNMEEDTKIVESKSSLDKKNSDNKESNFSKSKTLDIKHTCKDKEVISNFKKSRTPKYELELDSSDKDKTTTTEKNKTNDVQDCKTNDSNTQDHSFIKHVETENTLHNLANTSIDNVEKRITRSVSKNLSIDSVVEISPVKRTKRGKKSFVHESDSDDNDKKMENIKFTNLLLSDSDKNIETDKDIEKANNKQQNSDDMVTKMRDLNTHEVLSNTDKKLDDKKASSDLGTGFGIDDLEIFSDNIASDPVMDNINALIADLDHDLDSAKSVDTNSNFTKELTLETMLENITSPENNENKHDTPDKTSPESPESEKNNDTKFKFLNESEVAHSKENKKNESKISDSNASTLGADENDSTSTFNHQEGELLNESKNKNSENLSGVTITEIERKDNSSNNLGTQDIHSNEAIVSTSEDGEMQKIETKLTEETKETKVNIQTTPDSTINNNSTSDNLELQRNLPDSTNDLNSEMNSIISSTLNISEKDMAESSSSNTSASIESIGKLLSILQDKTKIKDLLSLLGDQSNENEKIKKQLEKLSEIVSDDEEVISEEKESEKIESTLNERESENSPIILQIEKKNEINDKEVSNAESVKENVEEINNMGNEDKKYPLKENNDKETNSGTNEENIEGITNSMKNIINEKNYLNEKAEISDQPEEISNKTNNQDDRVSTAEEIKVTTKKNTKTALSKKGRKKTTTKVIPIEDRRLTRSDAANLRFDKPIVKKPSRELQKLQEDLREMFIRDDVLSATGIRMCRLAKLVDETKNQKDEANNSNHEPVVILKKCNDLNGSGDNITVNKMTRKKTVKGKRKLSELDISIDLEKNSRNKNLTSELGSSLAANIKTILKDNFDDIDPYVFETDSINESNNSIENKNENKSSESESESLDSSIKSFGSTELLAEIKKKVKRKRVGKGWQAGIIKPKNKRKKADRKQDPDSINEESVEITKNIEIPDSNCFTDKSYCFNKNLSTYDCRLCSYNGVDIVYHYKKQHPHSEIPLSRMNPDIAMEAIKESEKMNFLVISKISSKKYICRFCFKEFGRKKPVLESFFWHVVSMHTGEYKQLCSECLNVTRCPFNLDIPPPPKDNKGQLLGYVCEKCNYTQISLENLKTHVIIRHNDEQTAVYTINLSVTTKSIMNNILTEDIQNTSFDNQLPRVLRSTRSNQSIGESWNVQSDSTEECNRNLKKQSAKSLEKEAASDADRGVRPSNIQFKITFENDNTDEISNFDDNEGPPVKIEPESNENLYDSHCDNVHFASGEQTEEVVTPLNNENPEEQPSHDIFNYAHFKIKYSDSGSKEYICCINGKDLHYRTTLLISFKKHVQLKHSENWDGYCFICKVIVTPQGVHLFKDCLQHFLDQHIDNFPVLEEITPEQVLSHDEFNNSNKANNENVPIKSYINVRPLSELISSSCDSQSSEESAPPLPVIESVVSLGVAIEQSRSSPSYPKTDTAEIIKQYRYEEVQAELMSRKHRVVLEAMMSQVKLVQVFKCAGRFCSFTTDSAEDALLHASTHTRVGGEDSLKCVYCDYDSSNNAIDLITHVFKSHGCCKYACGTCFYRAAASQLVNAHIKRVHAESTTVTILHSTLQTAPSKEENILSREAAVPYYLCCATNDSEASCKFRTYTPGKFCEHLMIRHYSVTEHPCFMCSAALSTPADLIRHLKTHGLKLYQCTWCVFGADNETELLAHASANHPDKQPKAYLRIITNKEGTSEFRVLPLAHLNKSDIPAIEITPNNNRENPVREAERSMELEKLIGHTTLMVETMGAPVETTEKESTCLDTVPEISEQLLENLNLIEQPLEQLTHRLSTPSPQIKESTVSENQVTPIIKTETSEMIPVKMSGIDPNVVYCLDSDEEDPSQNIIDLSNDQSSSNTQSTIGSRLKVLPITQLFLCAKCNITIKSGAGFKKHVTACYSQMPDPIPCAHCSMKVKKKNIVTHYTKIHSEISGNYACLKCPNKFTTLAQVREHERNDHSANSNNSADNVTVTANTKPASTNKRKRSLVSKEKTIEPPEKLKRFGPHNVNLLPINPILDDFVFCSLCEFSTKVRLNMVRHLQLHAEQQPVPQTAPVNPVPHLETNEKHFDKMVNLASSSIVSRTPDKNKTDSNTTITLMIPPEVASRYPKYVPERHRHTCGAKGCSYISVDESMFKCHWETLHSSTKDFRCVHCPPHQHLDTTKPLTAARILAHLKMHDTTLYACSLCTYYHYKRQILENHLLDIHKGGQVMVVREESNTTTMNTSQTQISAPTMDLKPWQCGLCKFKSLLRPEVVDHCAKIHNSKMQYKCAYCGFRTSNAENITKHQQKSHSDKLEEIFYYYYREGSVADDPDGTPRWQKQSQKCNPSEPIIKSEIPGDVAATTQASLPLTTDLSTEVDLNLVKKEVIELAEERIEDLCKDFGEFCEPNGLKYKCSLCKNVIEDSIEAMQSHLFEELKYRKWGCSICSYKAFHKAGLYGHMQTEHRQNREPIALELDNRVETWVAKLLEYQTEIIEKNKENLAKHKEEIMRGTPGPSKSKSPPIFTANTSQMNQSSNSNSSNKPTTLELERLFGALGTSVNMSFCCPKCHLIFKEEDVMQNHLENELNRIRWYCSSCCMTYQTYHEAQFHCRSVHQRPPARPVEVIRDPTVRSAWIEAVIGTQKLSMNNVPQTSKSFEKDNEQPETESDVQENSLLVVRYEENVPTPEELMACKTPVINSDSDDDNLVIDESIQNKKGKEWKNCPYCAWNGTLKARVLHDHILRHYSLRPYTCVYCGLNGSKKTLELHLRHVHPNQPAKLASTPIPTGSPVNFFPDENKMICLVCRNTFTEAETSTHSHDDIPTTFGKKGEVVVKCNICLSLLKDVNRYVTHHKRDHGWMNVDYVFSKLKANESKDILYVCSSCDQKFTHLRDLKKHAETNHETEFKYRIVPKDQGSPPTDVIINLDEEENNGTQNNVSDLPPSKKVARKSTTKLPLKKTCARKSTTKLPFDVPSESMEFSYYGTKPMTDDLDGVTTMMSFCNTMVPFTYKKLSEIININPQVIVETMEL